MCGSCHEAFSEAAEQRSGCRSGCRSISNTRGFANGAQTKLYLPANTDPSQGSTFNAIGTSGTVTMVAGHLIHNDYYTVQDSGNEVHDRVQGIRDDQKSSYRLLFERLAPSILIFSLERDIDRWMAAPDSSTNYKTAREKHQPGTGSWLVSGSVFESWKGRPDSILWLRGGRE